MDNLWEILGGVVVVSALLFVRNSWNSSNAPLPPGPRGGLPFIGPKVNKEKIQPWIAYQKLADTYGDIIYHENLGRKVVVVHTYKAAHDLLSTRASIYSNRPVMTMARKLVGYDHSISLADYGPRVAYMRKAVQTELAPKNLGRFRPLQHLEVSLFLGKLLEAPDNFFDHVRILIAYQIFSIAYGFRPKSDKEPLLASIKKMMEDFAVFAKPGNFKVDDFPSMRYIPEWFPGASFIKFGREARGRIFDVVLTPFDIVKSRIEKHDLTPSVVATFLQSRDTSLPDTEDMLRWAAEAVFAAGSDTTASAILVFILTMAMNPEVQDKAHAELDAWIGDEEFHLPSFDEDRNKLPYLDKILWEVFRFQPVIPLGLPHCTTQEDVYEGYRIPKGATVFANLWAILNDGRIYPEPEKFDPDRYNRAVPEENINMDPRKVVFGFGRRICVGQHLAEASLWMAIASVLMVYKITPAKDNKGVNIPISAAFTPGVITRSLPFKCAFTPRSGKALALVKSSYADALAKVNTEIQ
ncbi:cytochrome P450 [Rhodocollybia butyracea]|uniref:Cytochrome P450 n=1 Tax=Rhodocollybia butyracea TaxID=206335 RepID=A0A9P5P5H4_9AGAR|nr:cytochrome P450 [Rhodocollybia butyracea]